MVEAHEYYEISVCIAFDPGQVPMCHLNPKYVESVY